MTEKQSSVRLDRFSARLVALPRIMRIIIAAFFAILVVILLDRLFVPSYYTESRTFTFLLSVAAGILWYGWGWSSLIGFSGDGTPPPASRRLNLYVLCSIILGVITLIMLAIDVISGSLA